MRRMTLAIMVIALLVAACASNEDFPIPIPSPFRIEVTPPLTLSPTASPIPTPYQRKYSGTEAAKIVQETIDDFISDFVGDETADGVVIYAKVEECKTLDFDELTRAWFVLCRLKQVTKSWDGQVLPPRYDEFLWRFYEESGDIDPVY